MKSSRLLIIEPDRKLSEVYKKFFESCGYKVDTAFHPQDAIMLADKAKPDLIILELQLVGHSGVEFLYEFRSYSEWNDVPVVLLTFVTPFSLGITQEVMDEFGIARCLYKPATKLSQLKSVVNSVLSVAV